MAVSSARHENEEDSTIPSKRYPVNTDSSTDCSTSNEKNNSSSPGEEAKLAMPSFDCLPDGVVLRIFALLPVPELLGAVRGTCRRWRHLALRREVWQPCALAVRRKPMTAREEALAFRVMRLAPCLRVLRLRLSAMPRYLVELACVSQCAVSALHLTLALATPEEVRAAIRIIQNQTCNLHRLRLRILSASLDGTGLAEMLKVVVRMRLLEFSLSLQLHDPEPLLDKSQEAPGEVHEATQPAERLQPQPPLEHQLDEIYSTVEAAGCGSLKTLQMEGESEKVAEFLLHVYSDSVESVDLSCSLREQVMQRLQECRRLTSLALRALSLLQGVYEDREKLVASLKPILHRLTSFHMSFDPVAQDSSMLQEVLDAMTNSTLKYLCFNNLPLHQHNAILLARAITDLPELSKLRLDNVPQVELLIDVLALKDESKFQLLEIRGHPISGEQCAALFRLLRRCPGLHFIGELLVKPPEVFGVRADEHVDCNVCHEHRSQVQRWQRLEDFDYNGKSSSVVTQLLSWDPWSQKEQVGTLEENEVPIDKSVLQVWCCCSD